MRRGVTRQRPLSMLMMFWKAGSEGSARMVPVKLEEESCFRRQSRGGGRDAVEGRQTSASNRAIAAKRIDIRGCERVPCAALAAAVAFGSVALCLEASGVRLLQRRVISSVQLQQHSSSSSSSSSSKQQQQQQQQTRQNHIVH